jgi:hypothetical protein
MTKECKLEAEIKERFPQIEAANCVNLIPQFEFIFAA